MEYAELPAVVSTAPALREEVEARTGGGVEKRRTP